MPSEATKRGRRSMRCGSATLGGFGIGEGVEGGEDAFVHLLDFVILSAQYSVSATFLSAIGALGNSGASNNAKSIDRIVFVLQTSNEAVSPSYVCEVLSEQRWTCSESLCLLCGQLLHPSLIFKKQAVTKRSRPLALICRSWLQRPWTRPDVF